MKQRSRYILFTHGTQLDGDQNWSVSVHSHHYARPSASDYVLLPPSTPLPRERVAVGGLWPYMFHSLSEWSIGTS